MLTPKARVHCASCRDALIEGGNPVGVIVHEEGEAEYHLWPSSGPGYTASATTVCGLDPKDYSTRLGMHGVELDPRQLVSDWLAPYEACRKCFAHVW